MATLSGSRSGSGSPGATGERALPKAEKRRILQREAGVISTAVKLIPTFQALVSNLQKGKQWPVTIPGRGQVMLGQKEFDEFMREITSAISALPGRALELAKTRRSVTANAGFQAPARFSNELVQFFARASLGPVVDGRFEMRYDPKTKGQKRFPIITGPTNIQLQQRLFFTQQQINGQQNPLYGVISPGTLTPLFSVHSFYANPKMQNPDEPAFLSASREMREGLRQTLAQTIQNDVLKFSTNYPNSRDQIQLAGQQLLAAIDNPQAQVGNTVFGDKHMFNPNNFRFADFSKIISAAKDKSMKAKEFAEALAGMRSQIQQAYQSLFGANERFRNEPELLILDSQHDATKLAGAHKNLLNAPFTKERRRQQGQRKRQSRQQAGQQVGSGLGIPSNGTGGYNGGPFR